jgi:hypothetical protein
VQHGAASFRAGNYYGPPVVEEAVEYAFARTCRRCAVFFETNHRYSRLCVRCCRQVMQRNRAAPRHPQAARFTRAQILAAWDAAPQQSARGLAQMLSVQVGSIGYYLRPHDLRVSTLPRRPLATRLAV